MKILKLFLIIIFIFPISSLKADNEILKNKITKNLRCLICQGQSVYDSDSEFANSLKIVVDNKINEDTVAEPDLFAEYEAKIAKSGKEEPFTLHGKTNIYRYYYEGDYKYWIIENILNRAEVKS